MKSKGKSAYVHLASSLLNNLAAQPNDAQVCWLGMQEVPLKPQSQLLLAQLHTSHACPITHVLKSCTLTETMNSNAISAAYQAINFQDVKAVHHACSAPNL